MGYESMRIIAQAKVWNTAQFITAPILRIHKHVDEIQVFDGAYKFMGEKGYVRVPESTDGTKEILQALAPKLECKLRWIGCSDYYNHEIDKKLFMLKFWRPGEWKYVLSDVTGA